ncbi:MAG: twin-arginine translocase subunit TatC [Candidatus Poseidonia sp.]|nr:twin-arginine translocase subunit TatC [Poseidonia sp.]
MSVLLESDSDASLQSHLDELTLRTTILFISICLMSFTWYTMIDSTLASLMGHLQPCSESCLNIYEPAQWSVVRWMASILLGIFSCLPLLLYQMHQFAKPGLLPAEFNALRRWTWSSVLFTIFLAGLLVLEVFPIIYAKGHANHIAVGLEAQYSAVELLVILLSTLWILLIFFIAWSSLVILGIMGILHQDSSDLWRFRIYGMGSMLLVLSIPDQMQSAILPVLILFWTGGEVVGLQWFSKQIDTYGRASPRFDSEGRRRKVAILDCSCSGANDHHGFTPFPGYSTVRTSNICQNKRDRNAVIGHLINENITDAVITGCDGTPCPVQFKNNFQRLDATLHGLNLMALQNHRVMSNQETSFEVQLALLQMNDPFDHASIPFRLRDLLEEQETLPQNYAIMPTGDTRWNYVNQDTLVLRLPQDMSDYTEIERVIQGECGIKAFSMQ